TRRAPCRSSCRRSPSSDPPSRGRPSGTTRGVLPLRSLVDAVLDGALVVDDDSVILHANAAARRIARRDELAGRPVGELLVQHEAAEVSGPYDLAEGRGAADVLRPDG